MTTTPRCPVHAALVMGVLACTIGGQACASGAATRQSGAGIAHPTSLIAPDRRVRGETSKLAAIISEAAAQSETFRGLADRIGTSDGLVYVMEGRCQSRLPACLLHRVTMAGPYRVLWIMVDSRHSGLNLMASIGHELQHAVEVLGNRTIRTDAGIRLLFRQKCVLCSGVVETDAAVLAGNAVREELGRRVRSTPRDHPCGERKEPSGGLRALTIPQGSGRAAMPRERDAVVHRGRVPGSLLASCGTIAAICRAPCLVLQDAVDAVHLAEKPSLSQIVTSYLRNA